MARNKKPYRKLVKTSRKSYNTFTVDDFIVADKDGVIRDDLKQPIIDELIGMSELMRKNENDYYAKKFRPLIQELARDGKDMKGKKNAALRAYISSVPYTPPSHSYNFMEMLRYNIASKTDIYITRYKTEVLIKDNPNATPREIKQLYNDTYDDDSPSVNEIKKYQAAIANSGHIDGDPHSNGQLPLSATDGHYRKLRSTPEFIYLQISLSFGVVVLRFDMPKNKKRFVGKVCMPTVRYKNGRLLFDFPVETARPSKAAVKEVRGFIGVDAGVVNTASWCYVGYDGVCSQPFLETKRIRHLEGQVAGLLVEIEHLRDKAALCDACGWFEKGARLYDEAAARRGRVSRLKRQCNELVACEILRAAVVLGAGVAVEDLSWVPESHWAQADLQERLVLLAADHGLPVVKVSAAGTSSTCPKCGEEMAVVSNRRKRCSCGCVLDRDVVGARNVGARACGFWDCCGFSYMLVSLGSRAFRHECGVLARCNKLRPSDIPNDRVSSSLVLSALGTSSPNLPQVQPTT